MGSGGAGCGQDARWVQGVQGLDRKPGRPRVCRVWTGWTGGSRVCRVCTGCTGGSRVEGGFGMWCDKDAPMAQVVQGVDRGQGESLAVGVTVLWRMALPSHTTHNRKRCNETTTPLDTL